MKYDIAFIPEMPYNKEMMISEFKEAKDETKYPLKLVENVHVFTDDELKRLFKEFKVYSDDMTIDYFLNFKGIK